MERSGAILRCIRIGGIRRRTFGRIRIGTKRIRGEGIFCPRGHHHWRIVGWQQMNHQERKRRPDKRAHNREQINPNAHGSIGTVLHGVNDPRNETGHKFATEPTNQQTTNINWNGQALRFLATNFLPITLQRMTTKTISIMDSDTLEWV